MSHTDQSRLIADGLFTWPSSQPQLIGRRCADCTTVSFPARPGCAKCGSTNLTEHLLSATGTLWSWTSQGFAPKAPFTGTLTISSDTVPWYIGLVELPGELRVEGLLVDVTEDEIDFGMPMRLTAVPFRTDADGAVVMTFAFAPDRTVAPTDKEASHA